MPKAAGRMDDEAVDAIARAVREALADPSVRADVAALLTGADDARRRRLDELAAELDRWELAWRQREGDDVGP